MALQGMIVGLGNPGPEYALTRHNYGFMVVELLLERAASAGPVTLLSSRKDPYHLWRFQAFGPGASGTAQWLALTPLTFMNKSGEAVQPVAAWYQVAPEDILVLHDELDLPLGRMKLKKGGGNAGHNGLASTQQRLGTGEFYRLRLGIGKPRGGNGASFVLSRFAGAERPLLTESVAAAAEGVRLYMTQGARAAQQFCNGFKPAEETPPPSPANPEQPDPAP